ncbi:MAG: tetratricopeptide repeat protein [Acidobacteria bacterium]|nr:tetratricopeptide repeat protein [Acidobacteriota bacterium]
MAAKAGEKTRKEKPRERAEYIQSVSVYEKALKLLYGKKHAEAREAFEKLVEKFPTETEVVSRAREMMRVCDRQLNRKRFVPRTADDHFDLGVFHHNEAQYHKAVEQFESGLEENGKAEHIHYALAASYAKLNDFRSAMRSLERAIKYNPVNRYYARNDEDFAPLLQDEEFRKLIQG